MSNGTKIQRIPRGGYVTGFPEIPLTPETALLCDENINIRLGKNSETVCPQDPTCKKCANHYHDTKRLLKYFHRGDEERRERLRKWFPIPKGKESRDIIVCSVNFGQLYLFLNWACSCWKNQVFDVRLYTWIIPTDTKTYDILVALGFNAEPLDWMSNGTKIQRIPRGGYVTGFPEIPLTPETALLCDENINIRLGKNTETVCPNDPTCKKCARNYNETKRLLEHFHQGDNERRDRLQKWFPIPKGKESRDIIVCSVNFGQLYLFLNWACSCWKNQVFDVRLYTWIIPTDTKTYNALVALGFNAEPLDWMSNGTKIRLSSKYTGSANSGPHAQINSIAAFASNFAVQMGFYTLLMDVDMVFLHNPFPWLHRSAERRDVLGMYSPRSDNYGFMNSGFLFFVPTEKTKILLESYENLCLIKSISDQQLWNVVIRHYSFRQLTQRILPRQLFFSLWRSAEKYGYNPNVTKVLHTVSVRKASRLVAINQWHFNDKCPFWDKSANDEAIRYNLFIVGTKERP
mmetsp:Transcript_16707/g.20068  ORF Transcript_16707/g.20068 Transcript_16707/m.20068 type:complete len:517 (-) Transcript_16707:82-1632(-)